MKIFPAIDLRGGKVVRLCEGDYDRMTVYGDDPLAVCKSFKTAGAKYLHVVDLDGAKDGTTANFEVIKTLVRDGGLKVEVGGGIRSEEVINRYVDIGVLRVILGTVAVTDPDFVRDMVAKYGEKIAVGVDIKGGMVATHGWTKVSELECFDFCRIMSDHGVKTIICTDISKDGLLSGTNLELYRKLNEEFSVDIVASGGISTLDDVKSLVEMNVYGAILGKALYTNKIDLREAISVSGDDK